MSFWFVLENSQHASVVDNFFEDDDVIKFLATACKAQ